MSDTNSTDTTELTNMNEIGYVPAHPSARVRGEYHYIGLEDNAALESLLDRHDLKYTGVWACAGEDSTAGNPFVWERDDKTLQLSTGANPLANEHRVDVSGFFEETRDYRGHTGTNPGYLSRVSVAGEYAFAKPLWDDLAELCVFNKGMFRPLADIGTHTGEIADSHWPERTADQEGYCDPDYDPDQGTEENSDSGSDNGPSVEIPENAILESHSGMQATVVDVSADTVTVCGDGVTRELNREDIEGEIQSGYTQLKEDEQ